MIGRLFFVVLLTLSGIVQAQNTPGVMTVSGAGQVLVEPDMATISLGVEVEAPTADRALRLNAFRMREIIDVLLASGIEKRDIQTSQLTLHPQRSFRSSSSNAPLKVTGFLATNLVQVKVRNLPALGPVLDALTKSGANRIQNIQLGITRPEPHQDQARRLATKEALRKARLFAEAAGVTLGPLVSLSEGGSPVQPQFRMQAMADSMPIAEGELAITATVTLQFSMISP